ncbi:MAG: L,D-transpeptidase family protein [Hyphomicrobiales bacterium]|nr:L,D-transpeptidase family protein [Hyphomicrobiales bacterium]
MSVYRRVALPVMAVSLLALANTGANAVEPGAPDRLIDKEFVTLIAVRQELDTPKSDRLSLSKSDVKGLKSYYDSEDARLVWIDGGGLNETARDGLRTAFDRADEFGLNRRDYRLPDANSSDSAEALAETELRYSLAALTYATHAQTGRFNPNELNRKFIDVKVGSPKASAILTKLAVERDEIAQQLESFHPTHEQFGALRKKLLEVRRAATAGKVRQRVPDGPSLGGETRHPHIEIVRERLGIDLPEDDSGPDFYDVNLEAAVRAFQEQKGLRPDGIIGRNTREALNVGTIPVSVETILANMERWRWVPREFGKRHVFVNIPEYKFRVMSRGKIIHQERIVTGSPKHRTPIFSDTMETIVFNPYWNIPRSILVNEIIPAERKNPGYVERSNLEVIWQGRRSVDPYRVDWYEVNPNKLFLRQRPGRSNALGQVKFLFPNKHAVYMHDTPTKHLFNRATRAYSHGCIRVRNPLEFARLLLTDQGWSTSRIERTLHSAYDQHVRLEQKLPVHITYFTAWVDEDGEILGYRDVYGYDRQVRLALDLEANKNLYASNEEEFDVGEHGLQN